MTTYTTPRAGAIAAGLTGAAIIAASTYAVIKSANQDLSHAVLSGSLAAGLIVGAVAIGAAWNQRRRGLALGIAGALLAGEMFGVALTAERIVAEREATQAQIRQAQGARRYAEDELLKATDAVTAANTAAVKEAAKPGCKQHCRALLESQVMLARAGVERAQQLIAANPPVTASGTPLADRLGWQPWVLDLIVAALLAIGANGLGAALVAFGFHNTQPSRAQWRAPTRAESLQTSFPPLDVDPLPTPPQGPRGRRQSDERRQTVTSFVEGYRTRHGRDPSPAAVRHATGLPRATAWRYQREVA